MATATTLVTPTEFQIVQQPRISYSGSRFDHLILRIQDSERGQLFRVITFQELVYIPIETREDPDVMGKQWGVIRGLYDAGVDFIYAAMGVFKPEHLGIGQFYGAAAEAYTEEGAISAARENMGAVIAAMANFPHMRMKPPSPERIGLLLARIERLPRILAVLGHPDPRLARKGLGRDGDMGEADDELLSQQGENLLRGLAKLRQDFVFTVTAHHIERKRLAKALVRMGRWSSQFASRQRGAIGASFSIAIPLAAALGSNTGSSLGSGRTHATSHADSVAHSHGTSEAHSWGHGVSHGETRGEADTASVAVTNGTVVSHGGGVTHSVADTSSWAHTASQAQTSSVADTSSWAHTASQAQTDSVADTSSWAHTNSMAQTDSVADTSSWAHTDSHGTSVSHSSGTSHTVSDGVSSTWSHAVSTGDTTSQGTTQSQTAGLGVTDSSTHAEGTGTMQSNSVVNTRSATGSLQISDGTSHVDTSNTSDTRGVGVTISTSAQAGIPGVANVSGGLATNFNGSHSWGSGTADGSTHGVANGAATTTGQAVGSVMGTSTSQVDTHGTAVSQNVTVGSSQSSGSAHSVSVTDSVGGGTSHVVSNGSFQSTTHGESWGTADTTGGAHTVGHATTRGSADTRGGAHTVGHATTRGTADTRGGAHSVGYAVSHGTADTRGGAHTVGVARSSTWGIARSHSITTGRAHTVSRAESVGESWSEGRSVGRSEGWGRSHTDGQSRAMSIARAGTRGYLGGLGAGIVPGVALTRSWQTEDDVAIHLTALSRQLLSLLNQAAAEGGFYTTATLAVADEGLRAAKAAVVQAFHGPNVPTPVQTVEASDVLRPFMLAFRPSLQPDGDPFGVGLWTKWGTLHTVSMLAALSAPNLFEEGVAMTVQEKMPAGLAFYPLMEGDVILGHQVSPETYDLTTASLKLARKRHFHTAFVGDTGYGKSVAAVRMVYETTLKWKMKTIVLDFGAGWRQLLNAPGLEGHVEIRQLSPGGVRPLRWNPLQIGRNVLPEVQWRSFCDVFGNVAQLGEKRQIHELRAMLRQVYVDAGVLVDDPEVRTHPTWGQVATDEEAALTGAPVGTPLAALTTDQKQRLAVERSRTVGLADLYRALEREIEVVPARDIRRSILEGILFRLHPLVQGAAAMQYAAGPDAVDINEIVPGDWGVAILEGGAFLDEFSKAFLLGWVAWHIYTDAVIQRIRRARTEPAHIQIVFEEANKILSGVDSSSEESGGKTSTAEQFASMWRDSRKYGIYLHLITQSPSLIPSGIMSSCNNLFVAQVKNRKDQDIVIGMLHKSPVGFTDETWRRFLANIPIARSVVKLGYAFDRAQLEPVYIKPNMLNVKEPTDVEIEAALGTISL